MAKPVLAIVGRPNVGKSTFFNKLCGQRISIVDDTPGVTRDRITGETEWAGRKWTVIDTGGIEPGSRDEILMHIEEQANIAMESADVIVFMTDLRSGVTAADREIAHALKKSRKPVILAVNKVDSVGDTPAEFYEFYELGMEYGPVPLSSIHGTGSGDLLELADSLAADKSAEEEDDDAVRVAVIGKPNSGKSSLVNALLGEERVIVSPVAGTTRDAVDTRVENKYGSFVFVDTAGIRRASKVEDRIEKYSVLRAKLAVERADVCILVVDAFEGITSHDATIAGLAHEAGKACVIAMNKWDLPDKDNDSVKNATKKVFDILPFMQYAPVLFISAKTGLRVEKLFEYINYVNLQASTRIATGMLNDMLNDATVRVQPPSDKGRRLKIYYMTQVSVKPPKFVLFVNSEKLCHFSYQRYIENCLRETFGFKGTPIEFVIRERTKEE